VDNKVRKTVSVRSIPNKETGAFKIEINEINMKEIFES
jgi:hypothetical protein